MEHNKDRHLRNFDVRVNKCGDLHALVGLYDTGAALFSAEPAQFITLACKQSDNYAHAKPYANPQWKQLAILRQVGCDHLLNPVRKTDIYQTINSCFTGERAKGLGAYVVQNTERLGLLCP